MENEQLLEKLFNKERADKQFWIDKQGKAQRFKGDLTKDIVSFHEEIAQQIYPNAKYPSDVLYKKGWIMVGSEFYPSIKIKGKPTQAQINELYLLDIYHLLYFEHEGNYANYKKYGILCE